MFEDVIHWIQTIEVDVAIETMFVVGAAIFATLYALAIIKQLRLLNRFLYTPAGPVWMAVAISLLLLSLGAGAWYFLV